jgi:hypothetical protein
MSLPLHPRIQLWLDLSGALADAAEAGFRAARAAVRPRRRGAYLARHPGPDSPMWNACIPLIRAELQSYGAKARLARYLGLPRQRLNDFLHGRDRLPDAEITLRLLHWLAERRAGRDPSL